MVVVSLSVYQYLNSCHVSLTLCCLSSLFFVLIEFLIYHHLLATALDQFESKLVKPLQQFIRKGVITGLGMGVGQFVILAGAGLAYYVGGQLVLMGRATFPQIIAVILRYI